MEYSVGELAKRSGLTVRALHHYEKRGLLQPSGRSEAGYRRHGEADVLRLHRILALRQAGLALKDISALLDAGDLPLREVLRQQMAHIEAQMREQQQLLDALRYVDSRADDPTDSAHRKGLSEHLLFAMSMMRLHGRYFSDEDRKALAERKAAMGQVQLRTAEAAWPQLIERAQAALQAGVPAQSTEVQGIARRWVELTDAFVGQNEQLRHKISTMYAKEGELQRYTGVTPELLAYLREAMVAERAASSDHPLST